MPHLHGTASLAISHQVAGAPHFLMVSLFLPSWMNPTRIWRRMLVVNYLIALRTRAFEKKQLDRHVLFAFHDITSSRAFEASSALKKKRFPNGPPPPITSNRLKERQMIFFCCLGEKGFAMRQWETCCIAPLVASEIKKHKMMLASFKRAFQADLPIIILVTKPQWHFEALVP